MVNAGVGHEDVVRWAQDSDSGNEDTELPHFEIVLEKDEYEMADDRESGWLRKSS